MQLKQMMLVITVFGLLMVAESVAQSDTKPRQREDQVQKNDGRRGDGQRRDRRGRHPDGRRPQYAREMIRLIVPMRESDLAPLDDKTTDELLEFAAEHLPMLNDHLSRLKRRNPEHFKRQMQQTAPRLRHLKRIFGVSEELGGIVIKHIKLQAKIGRSREQWDTAFGARRDRIKRQIRQLVAESVELEQRVLEMYLKQIDDDQAALINRLLDELLDETALLHHFPPEDRREVKRDVQKYRKATDAKVQQEIRASLKSRIAKHLSVQQKEFTKRRDSFERHRDRLIDERVENIIKHPPRGPREDRDRRHRRGPGRERRSS